MSGRSTKTKNNDKESVKVSIHFLGAKIQFGTSRYADAIVTQSFMRQLTPMNDIVIHGNKYVQSSSRSRYGASNSATSSIGRSTPIDLKEMEEPVQEVVVEEVVAVQPEKKRRGRKRKVVVQELAPIVADEVKENQIHEEEIKEKIEIQPTEEKTEPNDDQYEGVEEEEERQKKRKQLVGSYFRDSTNSLYSAETVETFPIRAESRANSSPSKAAPVSMEEEEEDDEVMKQVMSLIEDLQAEEAENEAALRNASAFLPPLPRATVRARTPLSVDFERRINAQIESIAMTSSIQGIAFRDKEETLQETNEDEEVEESQTNRRAVGCLTLPKINMTSRFVRYIPNKNMGNHYLDHRLVAQLDVWNMLPESSFDFWLWIDKLRLFQPIAPHTHDPSILHLRDIGLEKYRRRFFTPFELLSLEENGGMSEFSDHSLAPESLFALTVQCRDWLDRSASSEGDDFVEKEEEEAEKELLPDHRPLDVIIDQMEEEIVRWHLQVNRVIARVRRTYFEHHLFWHEASIVSAVQQERKILLNQYRAMQRRKKVVSPSR